MNMIYHQIQGLYTAGDVLCAVDCVRALPEYQHVFFVNHDENFDERVYDILFSLGTGVRRTEIVTEEDVTPNLRAVFYHCVGNDDQRSGEYVHFREEPPGVILCAWIHTPGLCGRLYERYNYLHGRGCSRLLFDSSFSLHNTPGIDPTSYTACSIINPAIDTHHFAAIRRSQDKVFRLGRWSRGHDSKYSDDFLDLLNSMEIPNVEFLCMGIPGKFRGIHLRPEIRFFENGEVSVEYLLAQLDVLIFKTHALTWHEGWCRTVTEAMAAGVVPVVENRGGIPEQVIHGYNGFLCNTNAEFKQYCELLYRDVAMRQHMANNARFFTEANFGLTRLRSNLLQLLEPGETRRLNFGCGFGILPGYLNFDMYPLPGVDLVTALDPYNPHLPFDDETFDEIVAYHILEHFANKAVILEEIWRISRHNARIKIKLPDRQHNDAFVDPTHLSYWEVDTIDFYLPGHLRSYYSLAKFSVLKKHTNGREIYWELLAIRQIMPSA